MGYALAPIKKQSYWFHRINVAFQVGEAGMTTLLYSARHNLLIAGGKKGFIYVMDMRKNLQVVNSFVAHEDSVKSIAINEENNTMLSGSGTGEIKVFFSNVDLGYQCAYFHRYTFVDHLCTNAQPCSIGRSCRDTGLSW